MSLESDSLLAVTGIFPKGPVGPEELAAARSVPATFTKRIAAWMTAPQKAFTYYETPDPDKLWMRLSPPAQPELAEWMRTLVDYPQAIDWQSQVAGARDYLRRFWPKYQLQTFGAPITLPLSPDDAADVASVFAVLDDAETILDEMASYTLTPAQAIAFKENFPDLWKWAQQAVTAGAGAALAKHKEWSPTYEQGIVIKILDCATPEPMPQVQPTPPAEPQKGDAVGEAIEGTKTQGDRSSRPKSADSK